MIPSFIIRFAATRCDTTSFFGLPTWYKYLNSVQGSSDCTPQIKKISDVWLVGAALLELLLRVTTLIAIGVIIWGGIQYIKSQGRPDEVKKARSTIIYALIGLVIAVIATVAVTFAASRFNGNGAP